MTKSLSNQVAKASSWLIITRLVITALSMSSIFILARLLTPEDFGLVAIASVIATLLQSMVQIPVSQALITIENPEKSHFDTAFTINVLRTLAMLLILLIIAIPAADFYDEPKVTAIIIVFSIAVFASGFTNPKFVTFEKSLNFRYIFFTNSLSKLLAIGASLSIAYYTQSYWALVIGSIITQILNVTFTYCFLPYMPRFTLEKYKQILSFSVWVSLSHIVNNINSRFDLLLIGKSFGAYSLGVFNIATELASLPTREAVVPLNRALFPAFSKITDDNKRLQKVYLTTISILYSLILPIGFGLSALAEPVILFALGEKWQGTIPILEILAGIYALTCITSVTKALAMAQGKTKLIFRRDVFFLIVKITMSLTGFYIYGFWGILYAQIFFALSLLIYNFYLVRYLIKVKIEAQLTALSRAVISTVVMVMTLRLLGSDSYNNLPLILNLLIQSTLGALLYCGSHYLLWWLTGKPDGIEQKIQHFIRKKQQKANI